jgi:hypothetical protein
MMWQVLVFSIVPVNHNAHKTPIAPQVWAVKLLNASKNHPQPIPRSVKYVPAIMIVEQI